VANAVMPEIGNEQVARVLGQDTSSAAWGARSARSLRSRRRVTMTVVAITSESAARPPTAVSGVMPVRWRSWSMKAMNPIGIATERSRRLVRRIWRLLFPGPCAAFCLAVVIAACALGLVS